LQRRYRKWNLALSVVPIVLIAVVFKYLYHVYDLEVLSPSLFMSGLIAGDIFLLGFLIAGVLVDYKEGEKVPGDLAASFAAVFDDLSVVYKVNKVQATRESLKHVLDLIGSLKDWFHRTEHTEALMDKISNLSDDFAAIVPFADSNAMFRLKDEQNKIRRLVIRARTIRGTYFVPSGYAIAEATNIFVIIGLLATQTSTIYEAVFFVGLIAFLNTYMLMLIKLLDNPFDYYSKDAGIDEVSLLPLDETEQRIVTLIKLLEGADAAPLSRVSSQPASESSADLTPDPIPS
jgi:hypothetical protein